MDDLIYIDSYAMVGMRGPKDVEAAYETEVLLEEMEWCGIHGALVTHAVGREYDPMVGNRLLMKELKKSSRLEGAWSVMPHQTGEIPEPADLVKEMLDNGIRAATMYPRAHRYPFNVEMCGGLLEELEENDILLLVEGGHFYYPDLLEPSNQVLLADLDLVLTRFPALNVLLRASRWDATRYLYWLMKKHPRLHLELSNHQANRAMEVFAEWFGSDRILLGTGALEKSPGAAKAFIDYCTLDRESKRRIAGLNLARLLKLKTLPPAYRAKKATDPILELAKEGKPLKNILVIDSHAHINHPGASGTGFIYSPFSDAPAMVERAKTMGINAVCISGFLAIWAEYQEGNQVVADAMRRYPRFYYGYASLQPQYVKDWKREFRLWHRKYRMGGMKPYHPRTLIPYNDKLWTPWYEYGNRIRAHALIHPSPNVVEEINALAPKYPNISFIIAHCGASYAEARKGVEMALKSPNVYLEITLTAVTYRVIEFMVRHVGAERVLFGTDQPMRDPIPQFGWMAYSHCTAEEKKKMFGLNMRRILRRVRL